LYKIIKNNPLIILKQQITDDVQGLCLVPFIPIRLNPAEASEMTSQLLFGEFYRVDEIQDKWIRITTLFDDYHGWIDRKLFYKIPDELRSSDAAVLDVPYAWLTLPDRSVMMISGGSNLPGYFTENELNIHGQDWQLKMETPLMGEHSIYPLIETAFMFKNVSYLWGGRSVFGFDCSGFVQTIYKMNGIAIPKDTDTQIFTGCEVSEPLPGDLAFFAPEKGIVSHVGLVLSSGRIIHCSGFVRTDLLDEKGIYNEEKGAYTHLLHSIRRINH
jgi:gamma-D-glutamyl-L-lysine dipeptidyl-peptidase